MVWVAWGGGLSTVLTLTSRKFTLGPEVGLSVRPPARTARVVIPGVRRPFDGRTGRAGGRAGGLVHYALYEPGGVL
jgi:hypothetical protein